jgi:hypothetical protein
MYLPQRDKVATVFVGTGVAAYLVWAMASPGETWTRVVAGVVLALGFAASATAVVPSFSELLHAPKAYLATASLVGLAAFGTGLVAVVQGSSDALGLLVAATVALWVMATVRHLALARGLHSSDRARTA